MANLKSGSHQFCALHGQDLTDFFLKAQAACASGQVNLQVDEDGSSLIAIDQGEWSYTDLWYGGEPFAGITTIFYQGEACWCMNYFGRVMPYVEDKLAVLRVLMSALRSNSNRETPWRGPHKFTDPISGFCYRKQQQRGGLRNFQGSEKITDSRGNTLYSANYFGGIVNKD